MINSTMKQVIIYPGRFQPMLSHHAEVYRQLKSQFPEAEVFFGTSDKVESGKSPFNFAEKQQIAKAHGIDSHSVLLAKRPYHKDDYPFDEENTQIIFAVGEKDLDRFPFSNVDPETGLDMTVKGEPKPKYYQKINTYRTDPKPMAERGYITLAPTISLGDEIASASAFRDALNNAPDEESAEQVYTKQFGNFDPDTFKLIYNKITGRNDMKEEMKNLRKLAGLEPLVESFDPAMEPTEQTTKFDDAMELHDNDGEQALAQHLGMSDQEFDQELNEYCASHGLHADDDREEAIQGMVEEIIDNSDQMDAMREPQEEATDVSEEKAPSHYDLEQAYFRIYQMTDEMGDEALEQMNEYAPKFSDALERAEGDIEDIPAEEIPAYMAELDNAAFEMGAPELESVQETDEEIEIDEISNPFKKKERKEKLCPDCGGAGVVHEDACPTCSELEEAQLAEVARIRELSGLDEAPVEMPDFEGGARPKTAKERSAYRKWKKAQSAGSKDSEAPGIAISPKDKRDAEARPANRDAADATKAKFTDINLDAMKVDGKSIPSKQRAKSIANQFPDGADLTDPSIKKDVFLKVTASRPDLMFGEINARLSNDDEGLAISDRLSPIVRKLEDSRNIMELEPEDKDFALKILGNAIKSMELVRATDIDKQIDVEPMQLDTDEDEPEMQDDDMAPVLDLDDDEFEKESLDLSSIRSDYGINEKEACAQCGMEDCPCEPGECDCTPVEEGKLPAGLQAYQDKKNGKKDDADKDEDKEVDEDKDEDKEEVDEALRELQRMSGIVVVEGKVKDVITDAQQMSKKEFDAKYKGEWDYAEIMAEYPIEEADEQLAIGTIVDETIDTTIDQAMAELRQLAGI